MVGPGGGTGTRRGRVAAALLAGLLLVAGCAGGGRAGDRGGSGAPSATTAVAPPAAPAQGPGGGPRRHAGVRTTEVGGGAGSLQPASPGAVTIFEPREPAPRRAPVVVFTQGVGPDSYRGWIDHLVGRGSIVVFQEQPFEAVDLAERRKGPVAGLRAAVRALARPGHVTPEWDRLVLVGHSVGANMSAQLAADAGAAGLPRPRALFLLQPPEEDADSMRVLRGIAPSSLVLVLAADQDDRVGQDGPKALWAALGRIPAGNKDYVLVRSDQHGTPALLADHFLSLSGSDNPPDALDFYGPWKLLDALRDCAVAERDCGVALGGTAEQRFMGRWSDGVAVAPLEVTDSP